MIKVPGHRILIKIDKLEEVDPVVARAKALGIKLADHPDTQRKEAAVATGKVLQVGPTAFKEFGDEPWCKEGDRIYFAKYAGMTVRDGEEFLQVINDDDVVCVIEE